VISDIGRQMQRMEDDLGSFVFLYTTSLFFGSIIWTVWGAILINQYSLLNYC